MSIFSERHHFKLERWLDYGPIIAGAFASKNQNDVYCLRRLMCEMIERSPQRKKKSGYNSSASSAHDSDGQSVRSKNYSIFCVVSNRFHTMIESQMNEIEL